MSAVGFPLPGSGPVAGRRRRTTKRKRTRSSTPTTFDSSSLPTIYVDPRAGSSKLLLHSPLDVVGERCVLNSGDVAIVGRRPASRGKKEGEVPVFVGVEVKSLFDLIQSTSTGRLQDTQLRRMRDEYDVVWLLYYGTYRVGPRGELQIRSRKTTATNVTSAADSSGWATYTLGSRSLPWTYVEAFLLSAAENGVRVKHVFDIAEAAAWIGALAAWWTKQKHSAFRSFDVSQDPVFLAEDGLEPGVRRMARVAMQLARGVGYERAVAAGRHFWERRRSVEEMVGAGEDEWEEVEGIGKGLARGIVSGARERRRG